jgi:hypothetical protein
MRKILYIASIPIIHKRTKSGYTPLHIAAGLGHVKIVKILTIKGADVSIKDKRGRTPLDLAVLKNKKDVVRVLDQENENSDNVQDVNWFFTVTGAVRAKGDWIEFDKGVDTSSNMIGFAITRKMFNLFKHIDFELEGQVVKHLHGSKHWEINGLYALRWLTFPWNDFINTSLAVGEGWSYTTSLHKHEWKTVKGLHYMLYELSFSMPESREWSFVARVHHRSNIFGLIGPPESIGSNYYGFGIKYGFNGI